MLSHLRSLYHSEVTQQDFPRAWWHAPNIMKCLTDFIWCLFDLRGWYWISTSPYQPSAGCSWREFLLNVLINRIYTHTINEMQLNTGIIKHFHSTKWGNVWESTLQTVNPYTAVSYHNYCCYRKPGFYILLFCFPLMLNSKSKYRQPISLKTCCSFLNSSERFIKVLL